MSDILERAKAVLEGVSPPPWSFYMDDEWDASVFVDRSPDAHEPTREDTYLFLCPDCGTRGGATVHDAQFVAAARSLVPELVAEVERLRARETKLRTLGAAWGENSLFATGSHAGALENCARELLAVLDGEGGSTNA